MRIQTPAVRVPSTFEVAPKPATVVRTPARPDAFVGPTSASVSSASTTSQAAAVVKGYQDNLQRAPTPEELTKVSAFVATLEAQGKTPDEIQAALKFVIALSPEWQARESYRTKLGREPNPTELANSVKWGNELQTQGKSTGEMRAAFDFVLALTPEAQANGAYSEMLGRAPRADELDKMKNWGAELQAQGKSVDEMRAAFKFVLAMTPEWQGVAAHREILGRDPSPEGLQKTIAWGTQMQAEGKSVEEMRAAFNFVLAMTPEAQTNGAYQEMLGRNPTAEELQKSVAWGTQLQAEGKSVGDMRAAFNFVIAMTPEWQGKAAYQEMLGRQPSGDELQKMIEFGNNLQAQGKSVEEMRGAFNFVIALGPEWQARNQPKVNTNRDEIYLQQPNGWSCGPTSLSMAMAAVGLRPANLDTMWEMANALGARAGVGTPGGVSLIADVAQRMGAQANWSSSRDNGEMRAALERGHGIVVNGDYTGAGHFIYVAGLDASGNYIVCDPNRPWITSWNDAQMNEFTHFGNNPPGFAEIWR